MRILALTVALVVGMANVAHAGEATMFFPLSAVLPKALKAAPAELSRVLAKDLAADVANVPIEDAAELMECELTSRPCLAAIAKSVGAKKIVFGKVERRGDGLAITLTTYNVETDAHRERRIAIVGDSVDALTASLQAKLAPEETPKPAAKTKLDAKLEPSVIEETTEPGAAKPASGVTTGTWTMVIGGGITFAIGAGVLVSANSLRGDARRAPTDTRDQILKLQAIEKAGKQRVQIGGVLTAAGGIVATIGIVRMVMQRKTSTERPLVDVQPTSGGASVLFTKEWK
ncbi:MAG: hypothetical protein ABI867_39665 [Kofleriaceae bacterium]